MNQRDDIVRVAELIRLCAETMRAISRTKLDDLRACPFRHLVVQLEHVSDEIRQIAGDLPADWDDGSAPEGGHA